MDKSRVLIFIPALNEEKTINAVVASCISLCEVLVLDDGSIDETSSEARRAGAKVIKNTHPSSYDNAIHTGFQYAVDNEFDVVITVDADGQHSAHSVQTVLSIILSNDEVALVVGTRNKFNRVTEYIFSAASRLILGVKDPLSGLKAYRIRELIELSEHVGRNIGTSIVAAVVKSQKKVEAVNIMIQPRTQGQSRFGHSLQGELKILRALITFVGIYRRCPSTENRPNQSPSGRI